MSSEEICPKSWSQSKLFVLYDLSCTRESEQENAAVYYRPHNPSKCNQSTFCGQLAGAVQFCKSSFSRPLIVKTKQAYLAFKYHDPFVLILGGPDATWASNRLRDIYSLLEAASGDLAVLWSSCGQSHLTFSARIYPVLDGILRSIIPEIVNNESPRGSPCSMPSPCADRKVRFDCDRPAVSVEHTNNTPSGAYNFDDFNRELSAIPSISLPESGCEAFLKGEQILQVCETNGLAVTGATLYKSGILNGHADTSVWPVLTSLDSSILQGTNIFDEIQVDFKIPSGVSLRSINIPKQSYLNISDNRPKSFAKKETKKGLHQMEKPLTLSSLYSATKNSLHSYPSTISVQSVTKQIHKKEEIKRKVEEKDKSDNQTYFNQGISKKAQQAILEQENLTRSCRSLPGTPRKITVATMLPDVGNDSPHLRYKVLTSRRPNPISSSNNTPMRKPPPLKSSSSGKENDVFNGLSHRGINLCAPVLKRKELLQNKSESFPKNSAVTTSLFDDTENKISIINDADLTEKKFNIKNVKNKLNLHFAPDTINRPGSDDSEFKISREINGSFFEKEQFHLKGSFKSNSYSPVASSVSPMDEENYSDSEESDISVLELSPLLKTKTNVDIMFEKATKFDSPLSEAETEKETFYDSLETLNLPKCANEDKYMKVPVYHQRYEDTSLILLLDSQCKINYEFVCYLSLMTTSLLQDINSAVARVLELSETIASDVFLQKSYQTLRGTEISSLNPSLVSTAHNNFRKFPNLMEITLRGDNCVLWANRSSQSETFYQVEESSRPGLPIPSDPMARIPYKARKRLERDHAITVL